MNKYILIGIPGCGKTTLGKRLSNELGIPFFDTDDMVYGAIPMKDNFMGMMSLYYAQFRTGEYDAMVELAELEGPAVIATGAEVSLIVDCVEMMPEMGKIIHLQRDPENIIADLRNSSKTKMIMRNVLDGTEISMSEEGVKLYAQELKHYEALAEWSIDNNGSEDEGLEKLLALIRVNVSSL